ncbi:MAG: isochorismatase [Bacillota bacterium]
MTVVCLSELYRPRPIRFLELWQPEDWSLKVYGIFYQRPLPRPELVRAAKAVASRRLPRAKCPRVYGVGFRGVHDGRGAAFVFVDWWERENELRHHVYVSEGDDCENLEYRTPTGLSPACGT